MANRVQQVRSMRMAVCTRRRVAAGGYWMCRRYRYNTGIAVMANSRPTARELIQGCGGSSQTAVASPQANGMQKLGRAIFRLWRSSRRSITSLRICPSSKAKLRL
ncbi:hypothetical protein D3C87_1595010 [compost metagenome]